MNAAAKTSMLVTKLTSEAMNEAIETTAARASSLVVFSGLAQGVNIFAIVGITIGCIHLLHVSALYRNPTGSLGWIQDATHKSYAFEPPERESY